MPLILRGRALRVGEARAGLDEREDRGMTHLEKLGQHLEAARVSADAAEDAGRRLLALLDERQARREAIARLVRQGGEG